MYLSLHFSYILVINSYVYYERMIPMDKKLPKVFQNKIDKDISNNDKFYYSANKEESNNETKAETKSKIIKPNNINKKINEIFSSPSYVYKANVEVTTKESTITTKIIGRNKSYLITMDNKTIPIKDIIDIKLK